MVLGKEQNIMKQYLDVNGGKYLTTKMKTYVDDKVKNLPSC